ncbi:MAG: hypothetical protein RL477_708, partial [Pseudomonadota bacterium]
MFSRVTRALKQAVLRSFAALGYSIVKLQKDDPDNVDPNAALKASVRASTEEADRWFRRDA